MIDAVLPLEHSRMDQFDSNERKKLLTLFEPHSFVLGWCCWHRALTTRSALIWMIYINFLLFKNLIRNSPGWVDWKKCSSTCKKQRGKRRPRGHNSRPWWVLVWNTNKKKHTHKLQAPCCSGACSRRAQMWLLRVQKRNYPPQEHNREINSLIVIIIWSEQQKKIVKKKLAVIHTSLLLVSFHLCCHKQADDTENVHHYCGFRPAATYFTGLTWTSYLKASRLHRSGVNLVSFIKMQRYAFSCLGKKI